MVKHCVLLNILFEYKLPLYKTKDILIISDNLKIKQHDLLQINRKFDIIIVIDNLNNIDDTIFSYLNYNGKIVFIQSVLVNPNYLSSSIIYFCSNIMTMSDMYDSIKTKNLHVIDADRLYSNDLIILYIEYFAITCVKKH